MGVSPLHCHSAMKLPVSLFLPSLVFLTSPLLVAQPKIMPLGDSITWGSHRTETIPGGYRKELAARLTGAGISFDFVGHGTGNPAPGVDPNHNGNPGIRTDQVLANLQTWMSANPDVVLMKLGTNDMLQKVPVHVAAENIKTLIHRITDNAPNRRLYVATIIPVNEARDGRTMAEWAPIVNAFNAEVRKLVAEHAAQGRKVRLADAHANIVYTDPNLANNFFQPTDGTHPATAGYKQLGAFWFNAMTAGGTIHDPPAVGYPNVPTSLTATIASASQVNLAWTDNSGNETGFKIYRKAGTNGAWTLVGTAGANVRNHSVTGLSTANTFYQFAVSATNASGDSAWSRSTGTTPANVALNRPSVATSIFASAHAAAKANDGDVSTLWGAASNDSAAAWRVDLGGSHLIHRVELVFRQDADQPMSRKGFEIQGSNDASFASYQVLSSQGATALMHASTFSADIANPGSFSHVRVRKTDGGYFALAEARIYGSPSGAAAGPFALDVASSPSGGVSIATSPTDRNGAGGGVTGFSRSYNKGTVVTLTAPSISGSAAFVKWQLNGADHATTTSVNVTMNSNASLTAVYGGGTVNASLVNGSFESGLSGWTTSGNLAVQTATVYAPPDGGSVLAFNGANLTPNGVLSQTFATTAGTTYTLAFNLGTYSYNTLAQRLQVTASGNGTLLARDLSLNGAGNGIARWTAQTFTFTANSAATTLTFRDTSSATNAIDLLLDHIRVTSGTVVNGPPVATADSYTTSVSTHLTVAAPGVLANDTDPQSHPLTAVIGATPAHGTVTLNANGSFTYKPVTGYSGTDSFTYQANDGSLASNVATVSIHVSPPGSSTLANGGFESQFSGWTTSGNVAIGTTPTYLATEGTKLAFFNGANTTPNGVISQVITTAPGQRYTLSFDVGVLAFNKSTQTLGITAAGTGTLLSQSITVTGPGNGTRWQAASYTFTADSSSTLLTFRDQSTATHSLDLLLDNVRVNGASAVAAKAAVIAPTAVEMRMPSLSLSAGTATLRMDTAPAGTYVLESSEDLIRWREIEVKELSESGPLEFETSRTGGEIHLFFRVGRRK